MRVATLLRSSRVAARLTGRTGPNARASGSGCGSCRRPPRSSLVDGVFLPSYWLYEPRELRRRVRRRADDAGAVASRSWSRHVAVRGAAAWVPRVATARRAWMQRCAAARPLPATLDAGVSRSTRTRRSMALVGVLRPRLFITRQRHRRAHRRRAGGERRARGRSPAGARQPQAPRDAERRPTFSPGVAGPRPRAALGVVPPSPERIAARASGARRRQRGARALRARVGNRQSRAHDAAGRGQWPSRSARSSTAATSRRACAACSTMRCRRTPAERSSSRIAVGSALASGVTLAPCSVGYATAARRLMHVAPRSLVQTLP